MADRLHKLRGLGYGSHFCVSTSDLPPGWTVERKSRKYMVWCDDAGKRYKSSREVELALEDLGHVATVNKHQAEEGATTETDICTEGESSEFESSPAKRPRFNA